MASALCLPAHYNTDLSMTRLLLLFLLAVPTAITAQDRSAEVADSLARDYVARGEAPSVAVALVRGADTVLFTAHGSADLEHDVAATTASVYRIGSVTKQFTAVAVMQLMEQGKLTLDDSIATHIDSLPAAWRGVTVRQLLNHTSGIPSYTDLGSEWQSRWGESMRPAQLLELTADRPMDFAPGSDWKYDNTGYVLLGMLVEKLAGRSWGSDLTARLTKPLGMTDTRNCLGVAVVPHRVRGYEKLGNGWINTPYLSMTQPYAAGAMCSSIGDMVRWNRALHTGQLLSAESYAMMITPTGAATESQYGFALVVDSVAGHAMITHGGGINGFLTANAWIPGAQLSVTVLTNAGSGDPATLLRNLVLAALGAPLSVAELAMPLDQESRSLYIGEYQLTIGGAARKFTIAAADNGITGQLQGQGPIPLVHLGDHTFGAEFDPSLRLTFTIEDGRATKVVLRQRGARFEGQRAR